MTPIGRPDFLIGMQAGDRSGNQLKAFGDTARPHPVEPCFCARPETRVPQNSPGQRCSSRRVPSLHQVGKPQVQRSEVSVGKSGFSVISRVVSGCSCNIFAEMTLNQPGDVSPGC